MTGEWLQCSAVTVRQGFILWRMYTPGFWFVANHYKFWRFWQIFWRILRQNVN